MNTIKKIGVYLSLFIPAAVIAGIYGAIHNQITYSLSTEYFTHFKFIQFGMPWAEETPRSAAALVGALSTWWMGVVVFSILGLFGFIFSSPKQMALMLLKSFGIVVSVALCTGLLGLVYGYIQVTESTIANYMKWVKPDVTDPIQFVRVGFMHNASYVGGLMGLVAGIVYLFIRKKRCKTSIKS